MLFTWKKTLLFVACTTLLLLVVNWLILSDILPIKKTIDYSAVQANFIQIWIKLAAFIGLLLPIIAFFACWRYLDRRKILGFYLVVLIVQIAAEMIVSRILFPSLVVISGTIYTVFRIWQLWQGQQLVKAEVQINNDRPTTFSSLLWLLLLFWSSNLIVLFVVSWPTILFD
ncbi:hypothetical protein [Microcoleus sp. herbarium14]|uniref:hypothetical protein n=1 Tax=Microcoleus sp. herbarium14 TaxID=3055439 RepID=UPI002FD55018